MKKGFTLIELLVVIAIIGILASVVLASLNTALSEGENARDIANLNNARSQAELFYSTTGNSTYTTVCSAGANNISALLPDTSDDGNVRGEGACFDAAGTWAAYVRIADGTTGDVAYCVDSTGFGGEITNARIPAEGDQVCT